MEFNENTQITSDYFIYAKYTGEAIMSANWDKKTYTSTTTRIIFKKVTKGSSLIESESTESWEIQEKNTDSAVIMANVTDNDDIIDEQGNTGKTLTIISNQTIYANPNTGSYFNGMNKLISIDFANFDTSKSIYMNSMFRTCKSLTKLDISTFSSENVLLMSHMFDGCNNLETIDATDFKTDSVTDMQYMFNGCSKLFEIDFSSFNTSNVKNMSMMFGSCYALSDLNLSYFTTNNVENMSAMFYGCGVVTLNLSSFTTTSTTDIGAMFKLCRNLQKLDIRNFNIHDKVSYTSIFDSVRTSVEIIINENMADSWLTPNFPTYTNIIKI